MTLTWLFVNIVRQQARAEPAVEQNNRAASDLFSNAGKESLGGGSKGQLRSTAHGLVDNLQIQLERERQQKQELMQHLRRLEEESRRAH